MMVANVFLVIIPNQKKVVADLIAGREPDPRLGQQAKQRSMHNNYLTLPVLFLMISNHYPLAFASRFNWLILVLVLVVGAIIRHFYNERHAGRPNPWWVWWVATAGMVLIAWLSTAAPSGERAAAATREVEVADVENIVLSRCSMCHTAEPSWEDMPAPPKGVVLDSMALIRQHAREIDLQVVRTHAMPPGNVTEITLEERQMLATWLAAGAPAE
jgi:uncharacterized membrane protein